MVCLSMYRTEFFISIIFLLSEELLTFFFPETSLLATNYLSFCLSQKVFLLYQAGGLSPLFAIIAPEKSHVIHIFVSPRNFCP